MEKYTFEQLDEDTQTQIMFELCAIGEEGKSWGEIIEIDEEAREWIRKNNEPKTLNEWQEAVLNK